MSLDSQVIVEAKYDAIDCCNECYMGDVMFKTINNGKIGFLNTNAQEIVAPVYDSSGYCWIGELMAVCKEGKWGYINTSGREVIPLQYEKVDRTPYHSESLEVKKNNWYGMIDHEGRVLVPIQFDGVRQLYNAPYISVYTRLFCDSIDVIVTNDYGDEKTQKQEKCKYKCGLYDLKGNLVLPHQYDEEVDVYDSMAVLIKDGKTWLYNLHLNNKQRIQKLDQLMIHSSNPNFAVVRNGVKWGIYDVKRNQPVTKIIYDEIETLFGNKAWFKVRLGNEIYLLDKTGNRISE